MTQPILASTGSERTFVKSKSEILTMKSSNISRVSFEGKDIANRDEMTAPYTKDDWRPSQWEGGGGGGGSAGSRGANDPTEAKLLS